MLHFYKTTPLSQKPPTLLYSPYSGESEYAGGSWLTRMFRELLRGEINSVVPRVPVILNYPLKLMDGKSAGIYFMWVLNFFCSFHPLAPHIFFIFALFVSRFVSGSTMSVNAYAAAQNAQSGRATPPNGLNNSPNNAARFWATAFGVNLSTWKVKVASG